MMRFDDLLSHLRQSCQTVNECTEAYARTLWDHAQGAKSIMEVGVGPEAVSGKTFAAAMGKASVLYSVDLEEDRPSPEQRAWVEAQGVEWIVRHGDSLGVELKPDVMLDLLYIDGDHGSIHVESDFKRWSPFVKAGGTVIFDDCRDGTDVLGLPGTFVAYDKAVGNGHFIHKITR